MVLATYRDALAPLGQAVEFIYVVSSASEDRAKVAALATRDVKVIQLPRQFGDASRLREGARLARAENVLILPPYLQVTPSALPEMVRGLDRADVIVAARLRAGDALLNRARAAAFRGVARATGSHIDDLGCRVRATKREVLESVTLQEDQTNFLPIFAEHAGFLVEQVWVAQATPDRAYRSHSFRNYLGSLLDTLSVGFLVGFLQKPFRLFGALGGALMAIGVLIGLVLVVERFGGMPIAERPALLLSVMLVVLGLQVGAVGLIAEVVLFTRLPAGSTYRIRRIVERRDDAAQTAPTPGPDAGA